MQSDINILNNIQKIEKYNNFLNTKPDNKDIYYRKLQKYSKLLSNTGIINYGGNITPEKIKEIIGPIKSMIKQQLSFKSVVLDNCNGGLRLLKYNHDEILKILKDLELLITRLLEQRANILKQIKQNADKLLLEENKKLKEQLEIKEKEISELLERIKQIPKDNCDERIKELIKQITAFIDYKLKIEDVDPDVSKFTKPIFKLLDDIDTALDKTLETKLN